MNVDGQKIPDSFQTRQHYYQVDPLNNLKTTVLNSTRTPDTLLSSKTTGNNMFAALSSSNGPSYNANSSEIPFIKLPSSYLDRPHPTIPQTHSQLNLQPGQFDISKNRGDIVSYRNCQLCQSITNGIRQKFDQIIQNPANEVCSTQSRNTTASPCARNILTSSSQPQTQVSIRGPVAPNTPQPLPSSPVLNSSIRDERIPYYLLKPQNKLNSYKLHLPNTDASSTNLPQRGPSFHQDIEPPHLDITSFSSRFNMAALPSRSPLSQDYSNKSATRSYMLDYQRDIPTPQSPESPGTHLFSSNPPPSGVNHSLTNPNYFRVQSNKDSCISDQTYERPTPNNPYSNNSLSQTRLDYPTQTHHIPTPYSPYLHSSLSLNRLDRPSETCQTPASYDYYHYNSFLQNHIFNSNQTYQIRNPYNPNLYNSLGQNRITNPVQTHQVPTSYNPNLYNSLSQNRIDNLVQTNQVPTFYNPNICNSLGQTRIDNAVQTHPAPTSYNTNLYNSLSQNCIANLVQTHQVPTFYNPNLCNSLGQTRIDNAVQTHPAPTSYNSNLYNSLSHDRFARPISQFSPMSTRYAHTSLPNSFQTGPNTSVSKPADTSKATLLRQVQDYIRNKNNKSGFGRQCPDVSRYNTTTLLGSAIPHTDLSTNQPTLMELQSGVIPSNPADQPNDASVPLMRTGEPTNLQTISNQRSGTPSGDSTSVPSAQSSLVQRNPNDDRETVLKLTPSGRSSNKVEQDAGDVPICVIVLSDDDDPSSNDSHRLVIDCSSVSPRSPTTASSSFI